MSKSIPELEQHQDILDKFESNFTIIINNIKISEALNILSKKLGQINKKKDNVKRKYLNDRLYTLIDHLKEADPESIVSNLYLVGRDLDIIPLQKKWKHTMREWSIPSIVVKNDDMFDIDYLNAVFVDATYHDVIRIMNKTLTHVHLNKYKKKIHMTKDIGSSFDINQYITDNVLNSKCLLHGVSSIVKNTNNTDLLIVVNGDQDDVQIILEFEKNEMKSIHKSIVELFEHMTNENMMHRVKVTKELQTAIAIGLIETIYCTEKMYKMIEDNVPKDLQNFKMIIVRSIVKGDVVDKLNNDFKGAIGYTYY
jgi:acylphosphatase